MLLFCVVGCVDVSAQIAKQRRMGILKDSIDSNKLPEDSIDKSNKRNLALLNSRADTLSLIRRSDSLSNTSQVQKKIFIPDSRKALWYALVFPGGGQIYNRKYWKLPLIYGGFMGCAYALAWNNQQYKDYSQAFLDIMDDDPKTDSYNDFLPPNYNIAGQEDRFKEIFKNRKDSYRRQRDLSIFAFIGVYLLSVIDAYVDAELSDFDISKDISLKVEPTIMNSNVNKGKQNTVGLQCSFKF